jgi:hypothetical protein
MEYFDASDTFDGGVDPRGDRREGLSSGDGSLDLRDAGITSVGGLPGPVRSVAPASSVGEVSQPPGGLFASVLRPSFTLDWGGARTDEHDAAVGLSILVVSRLT